MQNLARFCKQSCVQKGRGVRESGTKWAIVTSNLLLPPLHGPSACIGVLYMWCRCVAVVSCVADCMQPRTCCCKSLRTALRFTGHGWPGEVRLRT
jgi:hypothetical protein